MPKKLIILGAGGAGLEALFVARRLDDAWEPMAFVDDSAAMKGKRMDGLLVCGGLNDLAKEFPVSELCFHCAVGNNRTRERLVNQALLLGLQPATLIDPSVVVSPSAKIGEGTYVGPQSFIGPEARIGSFCLINVCASVGHHSQLGDFTQVCPGGRVSGNVTMGNGAFIGSNAVLAPGVAVGEWSTTGASSFVARDVPDNATAMGVPAKVLALPTR